MRKISDTIARLAALRARNSASPANLGTPDRLSALAGFGSNPGALNAKFYLPDDLPEGAPLVVVLHGCTQSAAVYDQHSGWSQLADAAGFALLYPEQQRSNNPNLCFNWFQPADVKRDGGEALSIRQMIEAMIAAHRLDRKRIFITGLSAGGAMAAAMMAIYPDVFAGGAIIAGLAYGSATTVPEAFDRMRGHGSPSDGDLRRMLRDASSHLGPWPRISIWQGTSDQTVDASNAWSIASQWRGVHQIVNEPASSATEGKNARQFWCDASGAVVLEINMVAGMGHGTPVDRNGYGTPGPYMLDVGISSTQEVARFWGIAEGESRGFAGWKQDMVVYSPPPIESRSKAGPGTSARSPQLSASPKRETTPTSGVQKIIEEALRTAGLMR
ncbi:PHB depolymerase family esterase [Mesorhizobium sp. LHD-90]|uniref:extracellular catalytic domain type 1 short-chain-length polyhydroxyalkanoate depolymerase n=1 Tax=Mesorhizobium sp. LHD-90 TaxID=3071414 RepID=UPI0027DF09AD|nr:PHB depolymerase family esterase [Mesorhizobium sp. LHD-90]MDQ6436635.1 PHB depolymerase family esterase [Mesorhizobium sp. LHD-90]